VRRDADHFRFGGAIDQFYRPVSGQRDGLRSAQNQARRFILRGQRRRFYEKNRKSVYNTQETVFCLNIDMPRIIIE